MNRQETILSKLKLNKEVKAFGFNRKELKSVAAKIADNLELSDESSDEEVNAAVDAAIEAVIPILSFGQSYANRVINDSRKNEDGEQSDDDADGHGAAVRQRSKSAASAKGEEEDMPAWARTLIESNKALRDEISVIKGEKIADTRRARLEKLVKDTDLFGQMKLREFRRCVFSDDDDFEQYLSEVADDLKSYNQKRLDEGLSQLGVPAAGGGTGRKDDKPEVLSEEEIKAIAAS